MARSRPWRRRRLRSALGCSRGVAAVEFALTAPVVALLMLGTIDLMVFLRSQVKIEGAAVQLGQVVSRCTQITSADEAEFWRLGTTLLGSAGEVSRTSGAAVIISAVRNNNARNEVAWQLRSKASATSAVGTENGAATIPAGYQVPAGQLMIVTEVAAPVRQYIVATPLVQAGALPPTLQATTFYLSRAPDPATVTGRPATRDTRACMA